MKRVAFVAVLSLLAPVLSAVPLLDQHWAFRQLSDLQRRSSADLVRTVWVSGVGYIDVKQRAFEHDWDLLHQQSVRWYGTLSGAEYRIEWNLLGRLSEVSALDLLPTEDPARRRTRALQKRTTVEPGLALDSEVDLLTFSIPNENLSLTLGRQSINFASSFFFSPLDLFAPFNPQDQFRQFRPGVDAIRATLTLSDFSFIEAVHVNGYRDGPPVSLYPDEGYPRAEQRESIGRIQFNGNRWSFTLQGGGSTRYFMGGGATQWEVLGASWGLEGVWKRMAYNDSFSLATSESQVGSDQFSWTASHSRQWSPWLTSRLEANFVRTWDLWLDVRTSYEARSAFSMQAQASPLWTLSGTAFYSQLPGGSSAQFQFNAERSLSDESVLALTFSAPLLWDPSAVAPEALFAPYRFILDLRTTL